MKRWDRLRDYLPMKRIVTYVAIAVALGVLGIVVILSLPRSSAPPAGPPSVDPSPFDASKGDASPVDSPTAKPTPTPSPSLQTPSAVLARSPEPSPEWERLILPLVARSGGASVTAQPSPTLEAAGATSSAPTPTPTPPPTDFEAVREQLQAEGKDLAHVKIGFHAGPGGNARGLGEYLKGLASAGVPAVIKSADAYGVCAEALQASPDHVTVFRMSGGELELPNYDLPPDVAAEQHWSRVLAALPPEFDRRTWLEVMNEPDKERADWLGRCAQRLAELALRDGYRLAAFGWSSGEPEPEDWRTPGMRGFLSLAGQHPDQIAVALHEYSYNVGDIANQYPSLVGRFQRLFQACDGLGIERPTVLITEWGWEAEKVPTVDRAMEDIAWASRLYGAYPEVVGVAIWYLGPGYGGIADRAQRLIVPLRYYAWSDYFVIEPRQRPTDPGLFAPP